VNAWLVCATILIVSTAGPGYVCLRRSIADALVALEAVGIVDTLVLVMLAQGFHREPFMDLAIVLAVLSFVGSLAFARFLERWL
jgi:multicomponent Na+:H+ antiporter subunit F